MVKILVTELKKKYIKELIIYINMYYLVNMNYDYK